MHLSECNPGIRKKVAGIPGFMNRWWSYVGYGKYQVWSGFDARKLNIFSMFLNYINSGGPFSLICFNSLWFMNTQEGQLSQSDTQTNKHTANYHESRHIKCMNKLHDLVQAKSCAFIGYCRHNVVSTFNGIISVTFLPWLTQVFIWHPPWPLPCYICVDN